MRCTMSNFRNKISRILILLVVSLASSKVSSFTTTTTTASRGVTSRTSTTAAAVAATTKTLRITSSSKINFSPCLPFSSRILSSSNRGKTASNKNNNALQLSTTVGNDRDDDEGKKDSNSPVPNKIIKQLEREEAKMNKKREVARERLNQVEQSLNQLQSKKQEYLMGSKLASTPEGGNFSETTGRSAVKALLWRVIAGAVTFVTSLRFSGSYKTALSIVGSDFLSKAVTMFIGERLMNKSQAGRESGAEGVGRSLMKALIWRLFAICNTLTMAIFIAKDISIASKIAGSDAIFKTALMFVYERGWAKIEWGKEYQVEYNL